MLYEKVKNECSKQGMSIRQLEERAGISNGTVSKWRVTKGANTKTILRIARVLQVPVTELLGGEDERSHIGYAGFEDITDETASRERAHEEQDTTV